jgi:hypothetical protein
LKKSTTASEGLQDPNPLFLRINVKNASISQLSDIGSLQNAQFFLYFAPETQNPSSIPAR